MGHQIKMNRPLFISILFCLRLFSIWAQGPIQLKISPIDPDLDIPLEQGLTQSFATEFDLHISLKSYIHQLNEIGYLSASIDEITGDSTSKVAHLYIGPKYHWVTLNTDAIDEEILSRTGFRDKLFTNKPFRIAQVSAFFEDVLTHLENTGYPFAQIKLIDVQEVNQGIRASVALKKNQHYAIDTIEIIGKPIHLNRNYIENIIHIKTNSIYDERLIEAIDQRIEECPFIESIGPYEVIFTPKGCRIILVLSPKKANVFDGIIGVQPQTDGDKLIITGDIKIGLGNIVGQGERLDLRWQRLQDQTQEINASLKVPFYLGPLLVLAMP